VTNRGVRTGTTQSEWKTYTPILAAAIYSGHTTPTQPAIVNGTSKGRYWRHPSGLVFAQGQIVFGSSDTFGSGDDFWCFSLPFPALRLSTDQPIGSGMGWQGASANPSLNIALTPTLMDPAVAMIGDGSNTEEDNWLQLFAPYGLTMGTGTITSGNTSVTVNHLLPITPIASDIHLIGTATTTNQCGALYVDTIGTTSFNANVRSNPGASGAAFAWKMRAEPNGPNASLSGGCLLISSTGPWTWASGHQISFQVAYEARK
jgi:hypothetical protein